MLSFKVKIISVTGNVVLRQEIPACGRKFPPVTANFFLWQEIVSCHRKFLSETGTLFLWHKVSSQNFFQRQDNSGIFHPSGKIATKVRDFWFYLKIATKVRDFCSKLHLRVQGFLPRFLAPWPLKSHPGYAWDLP